MPKNKKNESTEELVYFITKKSIVKPGVQLHSKASDAVSRSLQEVKEDWDNVIDKVSAIISSTGPKLSHTGYEVDEISIGLGFTANGKLAFIAEAGIEASIEIKFKKVSK